MGTLAGTPPCTVIFPSRRISVACGSRPTKLNRAQR